MSATFQYLKAHTHIKTLTLHSALVDQTTPVDYIIDGHRPGEQMVPILSICTSQLSSYRKRPSQAQVDTLSRILGGREPRWWIDYELPSSYEQRVGQANVVGWGLAFVLCMFTVDFTALFCILTFIQKTRLRLVVYLPRLPGEYARTRSGTEV